MCEICKVDGNNYLFRNGPKKKLTGNFLYKIFKDKVAPIMLCHIHSIELFRIGEKRFLMQHLNFARAIATRARQKSEDSMFGF
jgi:hypothetical protein